MGLIGAILGDIAGSQYEFNRPKNLDHKTCELFTDRCKYTDDTVMSIATKEAIDIGNDFTGMYQLYGRQYPDKGYGGLFRDWLRSRNPKPYNSYGNGSAMRVSYVADKFDNLEDVITWATKSAECTHNDPEGIKGAVTTAVCQWMGKHGCSKELIYEYAVSQYSTKDYTYGMEFSLDEIRSIYKWNATCQGSVPVAIRCFLDSTDYESCLRNVFSLHCDMDTLGAIAGGIAESFYGTTGMDNDSLLSKYLDIVLYAVAIK